MKNQIGQIAAGFRHVLFVAVLLAPALASAAISTRQLDGTVVYVTDGDTVVLLTAAHEQIKIRLASIDSPEGSHVGGRIGQPYSEHAKRHLASLVKGKHVDATCPDIDQYGRWVCNLFVGDFSVNADMVRSGWAWANTSSKGRYLRDRSLIGLQTTARLAKRGLWVDPTPIAPWVWRSDCWKEGVCSNLERSSAGISVQ